LIFTFHTDFFLLLHIEVLEPKGRIWNFHTFEITEFKVSKCDYKSDNTL